MDLKNKIDRDLTQRHLFALVREVDQTNPNLFHTTISTDEIDRYDEIVEPAAIKNALPSFIANPVVLGCHQPKLANGEPPVIGNIVPESIRIGEKQIDADVLFDDDELGGKYARKYRKKVMRAFSIGFKPLRGEYRDIKSNRTWIWTEIELLEVSAVAVPANRQALARARGFYDSDFDETKDALLNSLQEIISDRFKAIEQRLDEIKSLIIADPDGLAKGLLLDGPDELDSDGGDNNIGHQFERIQNSFKD
jgi:HK97 family phage prohead protease